MKTRIALAQLNLTVGDFTGNLAKIVQSAREAHARGARIFVAPELATSGYPPEDLLLRPAFYAQSAAALEQLAQELAPLQGLHVLVGHPYRENPPHLSAHTNANRPIERGLPPVDTFNAASLLLEGRVIGRYFKEELPNTEVFDEKRYFASRPQPLVFDLDGVRYGVVICEDVWHRSAAQRAKEAGAQVLLIPNASPYHLGKGEVRIDILRERVRETGVPMVYVNLAGAQDELVFDGDSFVLDGSGTLVMRMAQFEESLGLIDFVDGVPQPAQIVERGSLEA